MLPQAYLLYGVREGGILGGKVKKQDSTGGSDWFQYHHSKVLTKTAEEPRGKR